MDNRRQILGSGNLVSSPNHVWVGLSSVTELAKQSSVDECFQSVSNGKTLVANAITDKGVATLSSDTFATMAEHINEISVTGRVLDVTTLTFLEYKHWSFISGGTFSMTGKIFMYTVVNRSRYTADLSIIDVRYNTYDQYRFSTYDTSCSFKHGPISECRPYNDPVITWTYTSNSLTGSTTSPIYPSMIAFDVQ